MNNKNVFHYNKSKSIKYFNTSVYRKKKDMDKLLNGCK